MPQKVKDELNAAGIRAEIDTRNEKIGYKIREAQTAEDPVHAGSRSQKEEEEGTVSVRSRFQGDEGAARTLQAFIDEHQKRDCRPAPSVRWK